MVPLLPMRQSFRVTLHAVDAKSHTREADGMAFPADFAGF